MKKQLIILSLGLGLSVITGIAMAKPALQMPKFFVGYSIIDATPQLSLTITPTLSSNNGNINSFNVESAFPNPAVITPNQPIAPAPAFDLVIPGSEPITGTFNVSYTATTGSATLSETHEINVAPGTTTPAIYSLTVNSTCGSGQGEIPDCVDDAQNGIVCEFAVVNTGITISCGS